MTETVSIAIATSDARTACANTPDVIECLKKAMRATLNHWMETNEGAQVRAACAAAMLESDAINQEKIAVSYRALAMLSQTMAAAAAGVPIAWDEMEMPPENILPIMKLWWEIKGEKR